MDKYDASIAAFNDCAPAFEKRFMNLSLYDKAIEEYCSLFDTDKPDILEIGCGPGNVTRRIHAHLPDAHILATDAAEQMINLTKKNIPDIEYMVLHTDSINTLDTSFTGIVASFVLPFLSHQKAIALIKDLGKKTCTNGILYLCTMEGTEAQSGYEKTSFSGDVQIHFTYYTEDFLLKLVRQAGFEVIKCFKQEYPVTNGEPLIDIILFARKM